MKANVSLCIIARDEAPRIEQCLKSIRDFVEEVIVVDTGSTDGTSELAKKYADRVETFTDCNKNGKINNFSLARNYAFSLATKPWVLWVDADDTVINPEHINTLVEMYNSVLPKPVMILFPYEYGHDHLGNCLLRHYRERLLSPKSYFKWVNRVHEVIIPDTQTPDFHYVKSDLVVIKHNRVAKQTEPNRNLRILQEVYEEEGEKDARQLYYLGLELANVGDFINSNKILSRYVELSGWDDEKCLACLKIADNYHRINDIDNAIVFALKASTVKEDWGDAYLSLAKSYYFLAMQGKDQTRNFNKCIHFGELGLKFPPTDTVLFVDPMLREYEIHTYLNVAYGHIGNITKAIDSTKIALNKRPDDSNLMYNLKLYETAQAKNSITVQLDILEKNGALAASNNTTIKTIMTENKIPIKPYWTNCLENPSTKEVIKYNGADKLKIIFYVGNAVEPWNAETIHKGGIGGSETAVIQMSERFAKMGHKVFVYGDCLRNNINLEGIFNGVQYFDHSKYENLTCDVLITSRRPSAVDAKYNISARMIFLWIHDVHCGNELNNERGSVIDKIFVLSEWHKSFIKIVYPWIQEEQLYKTRNGIDLARFDHIVKRNPHRAIYSSSPDRGMEIVVKLWPRIRERVPDAELHIFYGFDSWENSVNGNEQQLKLINYLKQLLKDYEKYGVVYHSRVDQNTLAKEFLASGVLTYFTWFSETGFIGGMEAQAAGCRIVSSSIAAINETVGERGALIPGDWLSKEYQDRAVEETVKAMLNPDNSDRLKLQQYAKENFSWDGVAEDWMQLFKYMQAQLIDGIVLPYTPVMQDRV